MNRNTVNRVASSCLISLTAALFSAPVSAQSATPKGGYWLIVAEDAGMPMGGGKKSKKVCFDQDRLDGSFERLLMEAVPHFAPPGGGAKTPQCVYGKPTRKDGASEWKVTCQTPFGMMIWAGAGTATQTTFSGEQTTTANGPMGQMNLSRKVSAKRLGGCSDEE